MEVSPFDKLTLSTEKLRAVRETSTQWAVCWLSDMVDLVPISLPVLHIASLCVQSISFLILPSVCISVVTDWVKDEGADLSAPLG
jgi:hypothetical protein